MRIDFEHPGVGTVGWVTQAIQQLDERLASVEVSARNLFSDTVTPNAPEAPAPEAPASEAPVPEAPVPEAPVSEAPVSEAPAPEAPVSEAPA